MPEEELPRFTPSDSFAGRRPGYYFGKGEEGLGYYRDPRQRRPARERSADEPSQASAGASGASVPQTQEETTGAADGGAPLIEEIEDDFAFVPARSSTQAPPQRAPLSPKVQQYVDTSTLLTSRIAASDIEESHVDTQPSLDCHQTRQNLLLLVGIPGGHEVAGLQLSFVSRRLTITFCTRPSGGNKWCRHHVRRTLCRGVDPRQWHAEAPKPSEGADSTETPLVIVLRKVEQGERWTEVFDTSAAAVAADREPMIVPAEIDLADACSANQSSAAHNSAGDSGAGEDADVTVEDSAELDIAVPAGAPASLGPAAGKDVAAAAGTAAPWNASAASAAAQSASVMGQAVLLRTRLMYQLF